MLIQPFCTRLAIAGSIRREADEVKDIEIVCLPRIETKLHAVGLFGDGELLSRNALHDWAIGFGCPIRWIKPATSEIIDWAPKPDGKYWRGLIRDADAGDVKIDIFIPRPKNWGITLLVRTGSAEFSQAVAAHALRTGRKLDDGGLLKYGVPVATDEEADAFKHLGLLWTEPRDRTGARAVRAI